MVGVSDGSGVGVTGVWVIVGGADVTEAFGGTKLGATLVRVAGGTGIKDVGSCPAENN